HCRVSPPTLNPQFSGTIRGKCTIARALVSPACGAIRLLGSSTEKYRLGEISDRRGVSRAPANAIVRGQCDANSSTLRPLRISGIIDQLPVRPRAPAAPFRPV